jgi:NADH:ubiquinone oxidoreductase subunit 5 (subunit L)/multisubunit Na+/H+ antiporter MnhA subunit
MCKLDSISFIFSLYSVLLILTTIYRKTITYKGLFYIYNFFLFIFVIILLKNLSDILLLNKFLEFKFVIVNTTWLNLDLSLSYRVDGLSYFFMLLVLVIGFSTNIYILNYFKYEANEDIFTILIHWFIFSMLTLVLANNLFTLFLGWESIGITSFFLINFWYTRRGTIKSSFKAFIFNKISDVFLFIFIISLVFLMNTTNITLLNLKFLTNIHTYTVLSYFTIISLIMCSVFKSAQLFTHLWLPDSMEAPVPASALIHSATLVSAGIYLLLRFSILVSLNNLNILIIAIGSITALYGGIVSAAQTDMKKLLAYSTISHCGFLFLSIGLEIYIATIIYLFLHGLFKAMTFFCAGSFIRVYNSQDTRNMGSGYRILPVDSIFLIICALNLGGLPFSLGYLYKSILFISILNSQVSLICFGFIYLALLTGIIYTYRLLFYSIFDTSKEFTNTILLELQIKKNNIIGYFSLTSPIQIIALLVMFIFSIFISLVFVNIFLSHNFITSEIVSPIDIDTCGWGSLGSYYLVYYEFFYNNYIICIIVIFLLAWKTSFSYNDKIILFTICSYIYTFSFLFFLCEVTFWQKHQHNIILILVFLHINQKF